MSDSILVVINGLVYPYIIGGAEIFAHSLSNELSNLGYDVTLLGYSKRDSGNMSVLKKGYRLVTSPSLGRFTDRLAISLHASNLIRRLSNLNKPVIISMMLHSSLLGYILVKKLSPRCHIISFSGGDAAISSMTGTWLERARLDYYIYSRLAIALNSPSSVFIATTNLMRNQMVKAGIRKDKIFVIPRFVEDRFFQVDPTKSIMEGNRITFVGRFHREKGIETLLKAFDMVVREVSDAELRLLGEGPLENLIARYSLRGDLRGKISVSRTPYEKIDTYLSDSALFVLPSLNEGLPNALLQAMAAGLPIVASRVGGIPEAIRDGIDGILVSPESPHELASRMIDLLEDRKRALQLGCNAKKSAERYRPEKVVRRYIKLFERCPT